MRGESKEVFARACGHAEDPKSLQGWEYAIELAEHQISQAKTKIEQLGHSTQQSQKLDLTTRLRRLFVRLRRSRPRLASVPHFFEDLELTRSLWRACHGMRSGCRSLD